MITRAIVRLRYILYQAAATTSFVVAAVVV